MSHPFEDGYGPDEKVDIPNIETDPVVVTETAHVPITVTIDVSALVKSELGWTGPTFQGYDEDGDPEYGDPEPTGGGQIIDIVADKLAARLQSEAKIAVREAVKERALAKVDGLLDEILTSRLNLTNTLGEKTGGTTTVREAMIKAMTDRLEQRVDDSGKPVRNNGGWGNDRGYSYIAWHAQKAAVEVLDKEFMANTMSAAKEIKEKAKNAVAAKLAAVLGADL